MHKRILLGDLIAVDDITIDDVLSFIKNSLADNSAGTPRLVIAQNATKAAICYHNPQFSHQINQADLLIPDGTAILMSAKILGHHIASRVTGIDVMEQMLHIANSQKRKVFFLGATESVRLKLVENIKRTFPNLILSGSINGYFSEQQHPKILETINKAKPDMLFVALGSPRQENWLFTNRSRIHARICIGVGGSFDILAGIKKRAPLLLQQGGLEGVYRICKEPYRLFRLKPYIVLAYFTAKNWIKTHWNHSRL